MRLSSQQVETLKRVSIEIFGPESSLLVFGSRVDNQRRGGDIDLYVTGFDRTVEQQLDAKLRFLVKVKRELGDQRIDVVFAPAPGQPILPIHRIAEQTGVRL